MDERRTCLSAHIGEVIAQQQQADHSSLTATVGNHRALLQTSELEHAYPRGQLLTQFRSCGEQTARQAQVSVWVEVYP